jgi:hypothetical protein
MSYLGAGFATFVRYVERNHTPRCWMGLGPGMDKLLSLVTPWMMMKFFRWRMVRHILSVVQMTKVVCPGVPNFPAGSMRMT